MLYRICDQRAYTHCSWLPFLGLENWQVDESTSYTLPLQQRTKEAISISILVISDKPYSPCYGELTTATAPEIKYEASMDQRLIGAIIAYSVLEATICSRSSSSNILTASAITATEQIKQHYADVLGRHPPESFRWTLVTSTIFGSGQNPAG